MREFEGLIECAIYSIPDRCKKKFQVIITSLSWLLPNAVEMPPGSECPIADSEKQTFKEAS